MTEIATTQLDGAEVLAREVRAFGWRAFDLADALSAPTQPAPAAQAAPAAQTSAPALARRLGSLAARASRHLAQRALAFEEAAVRRQTEQAFKCLCDAVDLLDAISVAVPNLAIDASALAAEATGLSEQLFELCPAT